MVDQFGNPVNPNAPVAAQAPPVTDAQAQAAAQTPVVEAPVQVVAPAPESQPTASTDAAVVSTPPTANAAAGEDTDVGKLSQQQAGDILAGAQAGKRELSAKEQAALDEATALAKDIAGYESFQYHGRPMYRVLESPSHTFSKEQDAINFVTAMRFTNNMNTNS